MSAVHPYIFLTVTKENENMRCLAKQRIVTWGVRALRYTLETAWIPLPCSHLNSFILGGIGEHRIWCPKKFKQVQGTFWQPGCCRCGMSSTFMPAKFLEKYASICPEIPYSLKLVFLHTFSVLTSSDWYHPSIKISEKCFLIYSLLII